MFNFKGKNNPKLKAVQEKIGTREEYLNFTKKYSFTFTKEEKDTLLQASIQVKKKIPNMDIIHDAYELMMAAGAIEGEEKKSVKEEEKSGEEDTSDIDDNIDKPHINSAIEKYRIYVNPQGKYKAVKKGWSWTAFFFTGIWALVNKMWVLGIAATIMEISLSVGPTIVLNLFWSAILGYKGNKLLRNHLLRSGYDLVGVSCKETADGAISEYLKNTQGSSISNNSKVQATVSKDNEPVSYVHEIRKLGELKEEGLLTEEEFLSQKQKLLNK